MRIIKPDNLALIFCSYTFQKSCYLSLGAMAFFCLDEKAPSRILDESEMWQTVETALGKDETLDVGMPKARGEYLVYGSCFSPIPVAGMEVFVRLGSLSKALAVLGDRHWRNNGMPSVPVKFKHMPINYAHAFGGEKYPLNPLGKGINPDEKGMISLPNIEDPDNFIGSSDEKPEPAGFSAIPFSWQQRSRYLGTFGSDWLVEDWPNYPKDTNWLYFNTAPENQRTEGFFSGNEHIEIKNMHPAKQHILSSLPGLRARIFINQKEISGEVFKEIGTRAETVWLFPDKERGIVLYRGVVPVADDEYDDVLHVLAEWELLSDKPKPVEYYYNMFKEQTAPPVEAHQTEEKKGESSVPKPDKDMKQATPQTSDKTEPVAEGVADADKASRELTEQMKSLEAAIDEQLKKLGITPEEAVKRYSSVKESSKKTVISLDELKKMTDSLDKELQAVMTKAGIKKEDVERFLKIKPEMSEQGVLEILGGLKKVGATNPELNALLNEFDTLLKAFPFLAGMATEKNKQDAPQEKMEADSAKEPEKDRTDKMKGDLTGADFSGQNLSGVDFSGKILEKAVFKKANLSGAKFAGCVLSGADFSDAIMTGVSLFFVSAPDAVFRKANLEKADMSGGDFTNADFSEASMNGARMSDARYENVKMVKTACSNADALGATFYEADLTEAVFDDSNLTDADMTNATISRTSFIRANGANLRLYGAKGDSPNLEYASLNGSRADYETQISNARLSKADLSGSCWEGAKLVKAHMVDARMDRADFSRADFTDAVLTGVVARETRFDKAVLDRADLSYANLFKGSLRKSSISDTNLTSSNLFGVDFYKAKMKRVDLNNANTKRTVFSLGLDI